MTESWGGSLCSVPCGANKAPGLRSDPFWFHNTSSHDTKAALTNCPVSLTPEQVSGLWGEDGIAKAKVQLTSGKVCVWGGPQEGGCRFRSRG